MAIFFGDHEFLDLGEIELGAADVQQVYFGSRLIWPPGGIDTHYRLAQNGCKRVTQFGDHRITQAGSGIDTIGVQAILDRMCALTPTETQAITDFYLCAIAAGIWPKIKNMWATGLNRLDHRTGWIEDRIALDPSQTGKIVVSTAGIGAPIWQNDGSKRTLFPENTWFRTTNNTDAIFGPKQVSGLFCYLSEWATFDGNYIHDIYGAQDIAGNRYYNRWRGSSVVDYDLVMGTDGPTPRPLLTGGDERWGNAPGVIGGWSDRTADYVMSVNNEVRSAARSFVGFPAEPFQFTGNNVQGNTQNNQAWQYLSLVVMVSADVFTTADATALRACMLQFARDIGVANVPPT